MSTPRAASSRAMTAPMRLPPVISAALFVRITGGMVPEPRSHETHEESTRRRNLSSSCCLRDLRSSWLGYLVAERPEERRALVRVAPLRAERRAGEEVLAGYAHLGLVER